MTTKTRELLAEGQVFGETGPYERLVGHVCFRVDPAAPEQQGLVDLDKAPRNAEGHVECTSDVYILKPVDLEKGNRRLLFEFCNRGSKRLLQFLNDSPHTNSPNSSRDMGNGFLMRRGYTIVWAAWQGDLLPGDGRMLLEVPLATENGNTITGAVRAEFCVDEPGVYLLPLSGDVSTRSYPVATKDQSKATFTRRQYATSKRIPISPSEWQYARLERGAMNQSAVVPSDSHIYLAGAFQPGWLYELIYQGKDPLVLGLGYLAVRELITFLRYEERDSVGTSNPVRQGLVGIDKAYCWGRSQAGRVIREFIYRGFNRDPRGRRVFDGAFPHVAGAGRMWLNHRFAQPTRLAGLQHEDHSYYADSFPFSYARSTDHLTGRTDAILKRPDTDPVVIHTQTSTEYWQRRGSLVHTDTQGNDLSEPENVRIYLWACSAHWVDPLLEEPIRDIGQQLNNVVSTSPLLRALLDHLDRWATDGKCPPQSRIPKRADKNLVSMEEWRALFPRIATVALPREPNRLPLYDYGPDLENGYITYEPPREPIRGEEYPIFVPAVDKDGNEIAGIRMPVVQAPLGTYTGWNIRSMFSPGVQAGLFGSYIPFPRTKAEREATGVPRASIEERYATDDGYLEVIAGAAKRLVNDQFLLYEDYERILLVVKTRGPLTKSPAMSRVEPIADIYR